MQLEGTFLGQPMTVRFPADSFFDVFVEAEVTGVGVLVNVEPVRVEAQGLRKLPPLFATYTHPPPAIPLVLASNPSGPAVASIQGESTHRPIEDPTFSLAAGGSLEAAAGYGLPKPPPVVLTRAGLGLQAGDEVDALSYGGPRARRAGRRGVHGEGERRAARLVDAVHG